MDATWLVFNNFLHINATDRSKISSKHQRIVFDESLFHFSRTLPLRDYMPTQINLTGSLEYKNINAAWKDKLNGLILDILVGWVPFYWLTKCIFMVWCMAPIEANGSFIIYSRLIRILLDKDWQKPTKTDIDWQTDIDWHRLT